ncbi:hypothetical protein D3C75_1145300 [compost metagenome]
MCQEIVQFGGAKPFVFGIEDAFGTAGQAFVQTGITGAFELNIVVGTDATIPGAPVVEAEGFTVDTVSFFTVVALHQRVGVGVLSITGIQVALTTVGILKLQ